MKKRQTRHRCILTSSVSLSIDGSYHQHSGDSIYKMQNRERLGVGSPCQICHPGGEFIGSNYIGLLICSYPIQPATTYIFPGTRVIKRISKREGRNSLSKTHQPGGKIKKYGANAPQLHHIWPQASQEPCASTSSPSPSKMERGPGGEARPTGHAKPITTTCSGIPCGCQVNSWVPGNGHQETGTRLNNSPANPTSIVDKRGHMSYHYDVPARGHL